MSRSALESLRRRLTYANVVATIALFVALSGGGFAIASHLTVRSSDIVENAVRSKHIKSGQVKTADLAGGAVTRGKLARDLRPRWAYVGHGTDLLQGRGVVDVRLTADGLGRVVEFKGGYDFGDCSAVATPVNNPATEGGPRTALISGPTEGEVEVYLVNADDVFEGGRFQLLLSC